MRMRVTAILAVFACAALVVGCSAYRPAEMKTVSDDYRGGLREEMTTSLFASDKAVLSGEDIDKILSSSITLPETSRLVAVKFTERNMYYSTPEFAALDRASNDRFLAALTASPRVSQALLLPSMLVPQVMTIPYLREAAARFQSELMLVYRTGVQSYTEYNAFKPDETRSYCVVEAVLLHVRTGIVVYSGLFTEDFTTRTTSSDHQSYETARRAELAAQEKAMMRLAAGVTEFLQGVPQDGSVP